VKKNILGMDMTEWKHLSGLADPYKLALAEAGVEAGIPPVVEAKPVTEDDDDAGVPREIQVAQAAAGKKQRMDAIKRAARNLRGKTRNAAEKAASTPAKDRYKATLELAKHRKTFVKEGLDEELLWAVYLEDRGTSAEEFGRLLDIAIESDDEDMAIELIAIEDQLDELLGVKPPQPKGAVDGAHAAGKQAATGAMAAAVKPPVVAPAAGGGAVAGAPAAGAAPAGAVAPAVPAAPAVAATPAGAPAAAPGKLGLLGTLGRGLKSLGKGAAALVPAAKPAAGPVAAAPPAAVPAKPVAAPAVAKPMKADVDDVGDWEMFIAEEFGVTAEQYVEMFDKAIEEDDQDILGNAHQIDEIFAVWRAKKAAAAQEKHAKGMEAVKAAVSVIKDRGAANVKSDAQHGRRTPETKTHDVSPAPKKGTGTTLNQSAETSDIANQIMESAGRAPRAKPSTIKELMGDQLRFSGYTDEHIARKRG
jgi:hypothetical protein